MKANYRQRRGRRRAHLNRKWIPAGLLIAGVLLIVIAIFGYVTNLSAKTATIRYTSEEVSTTQPILAIHEMNEGPPIPFLPRNQPQPNIQVPESSYNFGLIGPQDTVMREFIIRNTGDAPLTISRAYTTCGCTTAEISASVIPPGKVATVKLVYDAGFHDTTGQTVRRGLIIENNDPNHSQAEIWVQATVRAQ